MKSNHRTNGKGLPQWRIAGLITNVQSRKNSKMFSDRRLRVCHRLCDY